MRRFNSIGYVFLKEPKKFLSVWATFVRKLVAEAFKNSPIWSHRLGASSQRISLLSSVAFHFFFLSFCPADADDVDDVACNCRRWFAKGGLAAAAANAGADVDVAASLVVVPDALVAITSDFAVVIAEANLINTL